jgi:chorismate mutase
LLDSTKNMTYYNAFIGYQDGIGSINYLEGMPASIRKLMSPYLLMQKQKVIQETMQYIIDSRFTDQAAGKIYSDLTKLASEMEYSNLPNAKLYVVLGRLIDKNINQLLDYTIKQSAANWITDIVRNDNRFQSIADVTTNTIQQIIKKDYSKIQLSDADKNTLYDVLQKDVSKAFYLLPQIEFNPDAIPFTTQKREVADPKKFIQYLYNINYTPSNTTDYYKCYLINPAIIEKLINSDTLNAQNSDGNTPLHIAAQFGYPEIINILKKHGANMNTFRNNYGKTPANIIYDRIRSHNSYTNGSTVIDSISNFVLPFNDLLVGRLSDEKFKNNIMRNITLGVPISLVIYNHMFFMFLENSRYGFTREMKTGLQTLFDKYLQLPKVYFPIDLFQIDSDAELQSILIGSDPVNQTVYNINASNRKKIEFQQTRLNNITNQINSLQLERNNTTDQAQRIAIDNNIVKLIAERNDAQSQINKLTARDQVVVDPTLINTYKNNLDNISNELSNRALTPVQFYQNAFSRISKDPVTQQNIWYHYLYKTLNKAPSMIFSQLSRLINSELGVFDFGNDADFNREMAVINQFMSKVKKYIEDKDFMGPDLDNNPALETEFEQLIYLINLLLTPSAINILYNQIYTYIKESQLDTVDPVQVIDDISSTKFNNQTIESYMYNILPKFAVKYYTNTYQNSMDPARRITSSNDLFNPIIDIIKANKSMLISNDSTLLNNLREYLIPFLSNSYQNFITTIRLATYGYSRYLLNSSQLVDIMSPVV